MSSLTPPFLKMYRSLADVPMDSELTKFGPYVSLSTFVFFFMLNAFFRKFTVPKNAASNERLTWRWCNILASFVHSSTTGIGAMICLMAHPKLFDDYMNVFYYPAYILTCFSVGYFAYDFVQMLTNMSEKQALEIIIHHIFTTACFSITVFSRYFCGYAMVALLVEVNNIFLHTRQLLMFAGFTKDKLLYRFNSFINIGSFLTFRLVTLCWMLRWMVYHRSDVSMATYLIGCSCLTTVIAMSIVLLFRLINSDFLSKHERGIVEGTNALPSDLLEMQKLKVS